MAELIAHASGIRNPFFHNDQIHVVSQEGSLLQLEGGKFVQTAYRTGGQPSCAKVDSTGNIFIGDFGHAALMAFMKEDDTVVRPIVKDYEGETLKGPNTLEFDSTGDLYFTDSGPFGETGLHSATGSVFCITGGPDGQILRPLALNCLAGPHGIALNEEQGCIYVAETMQNRVLRFMQKPAGVYHFSVFHQFSGRMGPTTIVHDKRRKCFYVARYDNKGCSDDGIITVLDYEGRFERNLVVPGPEITGMCLSLDNTSLFVTESSTGAMYKLPL